MAELDNIRSGALMTSGQLLRLTVKLSWPAMMAQLSSIMMQYIDAAMVGRLGADDSAAVGLVSTSLWLFLGRLLGGDGRIFSPGGPSHRRV